MRKFRWIGLLLSVLLCAVLFGCGNSGTERDGRLQIVTTSFPPYDFARQVGGENVQVTMLLPPGAESHSYEPTPQDILKIKNCDVFIYTGGESDSWIDEILESIGSDKTEVLSMMDYVEPLKEETVEGMEGTHEEGEDHSLHGKEEYDEHVWTSPRNAIRIVQAVCEALTELDADNAKSYDENTDAYIQKLNELDQTYRDIAEGGARKCIVFGERFPFRYLADAYGLTYYAAFPGCSEETEPSAATIAFLIRKIQEEQIPVVFYIEFSNQKVADTICSATGAQKLLLHSCHNITAEEFASGITYLDLMRQNAENLKTALT